MKNKLSTPRSFLSVAGRSVSTIGLIAAFACGAAAQQWTGPDGSNNIANANSGNVGVGTTIPQYKLDVANSVDKAQVRFGLGALDSGGFLFSNGPAHAVFSGGASWNGGWVAKAMSASLFQANNGAITIFGNTGLTQGAFFTPTPRLSINPSGYVGIGTTSPGGPLDVRDTNGKQVLWNDALNGHSFFNATGGNAHLGANLYHTGSAWNRFNTAAAGGMWWAGNDGTLQVLQAAAGSNPVSAFTTPLFIKANGDIGIGTTTPAYPLEVSKSQAATTFFQVTNSNTSAGNAAAVRMFTSANNALTLSASGNAGAGGYAAITQEANLPLLFQTNLAERMRITGAGNIGIGTPTPGAKLHVSAGDSSFALFGPNPTWGGSLAVGSGSAFLTPISGRAQVLSSNGNLHLDGGTGQSVYLSWLNASNTIINGQGGSVGVGTQTPGYKVDVQGGQINSSGGLCIAGDCKTAWSQVGGTSQWTGTSSIYYNGGNVGIGTTSPSAKLELAPNTAIKLGNAYLSSGGDYVHLSNNEWYNGSAWTTSAPGALIQISGQDVNFYRHDAAGSHTPSMNINSSGNVGIGNASPTERLHVTGNGKFTGNLTVDGNINAKYQDLAEWVQAAEQLSAGTVVVLDQTKSNQVVSSTAGYDTRVAGVISAQPGITLGEGGEGKVLVATTGRVRVKVDASRGPIQIGDLLVTSDVPGVAMKSEAVNLGGVQIHRPGTIIGKALEPLAKGSGEILVLLSLQ